MLIIAKEASQEINLLNKIRRKLNLKRMLSIRMPRSLLQGKKLWIKLSLEKESRQSLLNTAETLRESLVEEQSNPNTCWFAGIQDPHVLDTAKFLGLFSTSSQTCQSSSSEMPERQAQLISEYICQSIAAEMSFLVSNGYSKVLSLPQATYQYRIYDIPDSLSTHAFESEKLVDRGQLTWNRKHRHPRISKSKAKPSKSI